MALSLLIDLYKQWVRKNAKVEGFPVHRSLDRHHHADPLEKVHRYRAGKYLGEKLKKTKGMKI